jgi:hypothetical protein
MGIPFSDVADVLLQAGYSPEVVQEARVDLLKNYPKLEAGAFNTAASTVQPDPVAPEEWVERLLAELQVDHDFEPAGDLT